MIVRARAPLRISFAGGGTDVPPYPEKQGGVVLSATIDRYAYCTASDSDGTNYKVTSADLNLAESYPALGRLSYGGKLDLVRAVLNTLYPENRRRFDLFLTSEAAPGSGLGSSSALMVSAIRAVSQYLGNELTSYATAELAYKLERVELKQKGGYQDQYAATFGGFNFIEFGTGVVVNPLRVRDEVMNELHASLVLVNLGQTRMSSDILSRQISSYEKEDQNVMQSLREIKEITYEMKSALLHGELRRLGELMGEEWSFKKKLDPKISNPEIDKLFEKARAIGAIGGKVLGAGDGGHALFYVNLERRAEFVRYFKEGGYMIVGFGFDKNGVQSWKLNGEEVIV